MEEKGILDQIHEITQSVYATTNSTSSEGEATVNEVTLDDLKKRRNKQLIISLVFVAVIIGGIIIYKKSKIKK